MEWARHKFEFQSTLPVGGATAADFRGCRYPGISIHAPRGGSDPFTVCFYCPISISIHAPRGGSDDFAVNGIRLSLNFNPRSPWGERPLRRLIAERGMDFNPRSPWGERRENASRPHSPW